MTTTTNPTGAAGAELAAEFRAYFTLMQPLITRTMRAIEAYRAEAYRTPDDDGDSTIWDAHGMGELHHAMDLISHTLRAFEKSDYAGMPESPEVPRVERTIPAWLNPAFVVGAEHADETTALLRAAGQVIAPALIEAQRLRHEAEERFRDAPEDVVEEAWRCSGYDTLTDAMRAISEASSAEWATRVNPTMILDADA